MFYAVPTARVVFTTKTSLDIFSLRQEQVWSFSVLSDQIYAMRCLFVAVGLDTRFIVLPHWDNMSPHATPPSHIYDAFSKTEAVIKKTRPRTEGTPHVLSAV